MYSLTLSKETEGAISYAHTCESFPLSELDAKLVLKVETVYATQNNAAQAITAQSTIEKAFFNIIVCLLYFTARFASWLLGD